MFFVISLYYCEIKPWVNKRRSLLRELLKAFVPEFSQLSQEYKFVYFREKISFSLCHLFIKQRLYWSHPSTHFLIFTCLFSLLHRAGVCFVHQSNVLCDILVIGLFIECVICKLQEMQNNSWRKSFVYCDVYHTISLSEEQKNIG